MCAQQRIGLYGGTFDPVHLGHLEIARRVLELFDIHKVFFIPAQIAPHKIGRPVTLPLHRYAMLALATQNDPNLAVSTFELEAPDRRYSVDTVSHFVKKFGSNRNLFFIMGADSWVEITTWREWQRLLTMVNHIVVTRPGYHLESPPQVADRVVDLRSKQTAGWSESEEAPRIYLTDVVVRDVSATQIRSLASEGRYADLPGLVPTVVADYIEKYGIYQGAHEV